MALYCRKRLSRGELFKQHHTEHFLIPHMNAQVLFEDSESHREKQSYTWNDGRIIHVFIEKLFF